MEKNITTNGVDVTIHYDHPPDIEKIKKACIEFMQTKK